MGAWHYARRWTACLGLEREARRRPRVAAQARPPAWLPRGASVAAWRPQPAPPACGELVALHSDFG